MQNGSMIRVQRQKGPDVWEFGWREPGGDGKRKHRRIVVGSINDFFDEATARTAIATLHLDMSPRDRLKNRPPTVSELTDHPTRCIFSRSFANLAAAHEVSFSRRLGICQRSHWWSKAILGQPIMRKVIRPAAAKVGITERIGWHTFRHTYSTLLRANQTDIKVMQELLRHAFSRVTLDTYTLQKRKLKVKLFACCASVVQAS